MRQEKLSENRLVSHETSIIQNGPALILIVQPLDDSKGGVDLQKEAGTAGLEPRIKR